MRQTLMLLVTTAAFAGGVASCASPPCGGGDVVGPAVGTPGPSLPQLATAWHLEALGETPRRVQANRQTGTMIGAHCAGGTSGFLPELDDFGFGWAQNDTFDGQGAADPSQEAHVCVFHPVPNVVPSHALRNPRPLASGALEGALWEDHKLQGNGVAFLLEAGVVVVARGSAVARVRDKVSRSATPPPPLPMANEVHQWTYSTRRGRSLHWLLFNGGSLELLLHENEADARRELEDRLGAVSGAAPAKTAKRAWRNGTNVYVFKPDLP